MGLKVSVFSVATNVYFDYWLKLYETARINLFPDSVVTFHVFTNIKPNAFQQGLLGDNVILHEIEDLRWPEATLKRYELIANNMVNIEADVIVYLDADMLISQKILISSVYADGVDSIVLVRHPGYWRPTFYSDKTFYLRHLDLAYRDLVMRVKTGGIGAWERNRRSQAYVKRLRRKHYFCGGIWLGEKNSIIKFAQEMYQNVIQDYTNGIIAIWHDESHLNSWASSHLFRAEDPSYCFAEGYKNLERINMKIIAVTKIIQTR